MRACCLLALGIVAALSPPAMAEPRASSYTVEELQTLARSVHPTLRSVEAAIEAASAGVRQARVHPNPAISASIGRGRPRDGGNSRSETSFELVQPIELPGVRRWRIRLAELELHGAETERAVAESIVDATVSRLAYAALLEERRVAIAHESARVAGHLHELLARRVDLGESPPSEAVKARTEWFARRRDALDADAALAAARSALDLFCGRRLGADYVVEDRLDAGEPESLPGDLLERLRANNPVLIRSRLATDRAEARIESARKDTVPRIDVVGGHDTELDRTASSVGVGFTIPLWSRNRGAVAAAVANRHRAASDVDVLLADLESELVRATKEFGRSVAAVRLHREGWTASAAESLDIATFSFENGEASLLDVLDAQRGYLEVRLAEVDSWAALKLARAEIERLVGGPLDEEANDGTR